MTAPPIDGKRASPLVNPSGEAQTLAKIRKGVENGSSLVWKFLPEGHHLAVRGLGACMLNDHELVTLLPSGYGCRLPRHRYQRTLDEWDAKPLA